MSAFVDAYEAWYKQHYPYTYMADYQGDYSKMGQKGSYAKYGPGPGGKAMASAPTLKLNAFCQKLLIWQGDEGIVHVSFNVLVVLAEHQQVSSGLPLWVINRRLKKFFQMHWNKEN